MLIEWSQKSPRWLTGCWFCMVRLAWAAYWFGIPKPGPLTNTRFGLLPIITSVFVAFCIGYFIGPLLLNPKRTRSFLLAAFYGILINHLITILHLPIAVAIKSWNLEQSGSYLSNLYVSFILSLAGIPIHTVIGSLAGGVLYMLVTRKLKESDNIPVGERKEN